MGKEKSSSIPRIRIIGGDWRGRKLKIEKGLNVQPTRDMVREALFDILGDLKGENFLDLYAGLGTIGIEALSRGASEVIFIEKQRKCAAVIEKNLDELGVRERTKVYSLPVEKVLTILSKNGKKFKFIFLDPPYSISSGGLKEILEKVVQERLLSSEGMLILEHRRGKDISTEVSDFFYLIKQKRYGISNLSFYRIKI